MTEEVAIVLRALTRSTILPVASALAVGLFSGAAFAHGGGGHGGGGHGGGGHSTGGGGSFGGGGGGSSFGGPRATGGAALGAFGVGGIFGGAIFGGSAFVGGTPGERGFTPEGGRAVDFGRFGGPYESYLYVGPTSAWTTAHWGSGFWAARASGSWAWYTGQWWVSPEYPGWVWMGPPWVWDGEQMISQEGYWTTVGMPDREPAPDFVEVEPK